MTEEEKQKLAQEIIRKIDGIFRINGITGFALYPKPVISAVIMVYQQGVKDAIEKLKNKQ